MQLARRSRARRRSTCRSARRSGPAQSITHTIENVAAAQKTEWLAKFLRRTDGPVLVFVRTKIGADRLARKLAALGIKAAALHADRTQEQRTQAVEGFRGGQYHVLVATDIAARGLDIDGITHVVNYEVPSTPRDLRAPRRPHRPRGRDRHRAHAGRARRAARAEGAAAVVRARVAGMMDDTNPFAHRAVSRIRRSTPTDPAVARARPAHGAPRPTAVAPAVVKFKSCRWRATPDDGEFCTHRDVLPFAGKDGFKSPNRGARSARSTSCAARRRSATAATDADSSLSGQVARHGSQFPLDYWSTALPGLRLLLENSLASSTHSPSGASS